jgi:hypothetical protein
MSQYGDGEAPDVFEVTERKARKTRKCSACGEEAIVPGHHYVRTAILYDGEWEIIVRCERCQVIFEHLTALIKREGDYEEFCDFYLNCGHEYEERWGKKPPEWLAALAFWRPGDPLPVVAASPARRPGDPGP